MIYGLKNDTVYQFQPNPAAFRTSSANNILWAAKISIPVRTYHPVSTSKKSSCSSTSLVSSNGRLVLALDEVGLSSPRSFASTSFAHMALLRVIFPSLSLIVENSLLNKSPQLNQERQEEEFGCLSNVECLDIFSTNSFVHSSFLFFHSNYWSPSLVCCFLVVEVEVEGVV
eukprot:scaffold200538_cov38-Attheya_sp.AAC.1